jgi:enoyl-CoA hydratase
MATAVVRVDTSERIATVTLNRPESRNAINRELSRRLWDAIAEVGKDPDVDVVILTGTDPAFCAGVDLKELSGERATGADVEPTPGRGPDGLYRFIPVIDRPVIAAVNGLAVTGGFELALQCTLLVASERARFADTHARVGIMPGGGLTVFLAQTIGIRRALELSLTGNFLSADEALAAGLVNHVVPHDDLLPFARSLAADIVSNDQAGVRRLLRHYRDMANAATLAEAHLLEGLMAETWHRPADMVARSERVMTRGRTQQSALGDP